MEEFRSTGWTRFEKKKLKGIHELDVKGVFKLVDIDRSGAISRRVRDCVIKSHSSAERFFCV